MTNLNYLILIENIDETHVYNGKVYTTEKAALVEFKGIEERFTDKSVIRLLELDLAAAYTRVTQTTTGSKK